MWFLGGEAGKGIWSWGRSWEWNQDSSIQGVTWELGKSRCPCWVLCARFCVLGGCRVQVRDWSSCWAQERPDSFNFGFYHPGALGGRWNVEQPLLPAQGTTLRWQPFLSVAQRAAAPQNPWRNAFIPQPAQGIIQEHVDVWGRSWDCPHQGGCAAAQWLFLLGASEDILKLLKAGGEKGIQLFPSSEWPVLWCLILTLFITCSTTWAVHLMFEIE